MFYAFKFIQAKLYLAPSLPWPSLVKRTTSIIFCVLLLYFIPLHTSLSLSLSPPTHTPSILLTHLLYQDLTKILQRPRKIEKVLNQWLLLALLKHSLSLLTQLIQRQTMLLWAQFHVGKTVSMDFLLVCQVNVGLTAQLPGHFSQRKLV